MKSLKWLHLGSALALLPGILFATNTPNIDFALDCSAATRLPRQLQLYQPALVLSDNRLAESLRIEVHALWDEYRRLVSEDAEVPLTPLLKQHFKKNAVPLKKLPLLARTLINLEHFLIFTHRFNERLIKELLEKKAMADFRWVFFDEEQKLSIERWGHTLALGGNSQTEFFAWVLMVGNSLDPLFLSWIHHHRAVMAHYSLPLSTHYYAYLQNLYEIYSVQK